MNPATRSEFVKAMRPVALELLGEPNAALSSTEELRFGARGSLSVDLVKGTFFDHETGQGGGVVDLAQGQKRIDKDAALIWLRERGHIAKPEAARSKLGRIVAVYDYIGARDNPLFQVVRFDPKDFRQRRQDGEGGWIWKVPSEQRVPYRLPAVIAAVAVGKTIYIAEGEKAVHALESIGLVGTCSPGGAGKWRSAYNSIFAGADVVVLADNDPQKTHPQTHEPMWHRDGRPVLPGQDHAADVARNLTRVAKRVRVVMLPGLPVKGDVADWVAAGSTAERLEEIAANTTDFDAEAKAAPETSVGHQDETHRPPAAKRRRVRAELDDEASPTDCPTIRVIAGKLHITTTEAEDALIASGLPIYQRGNGLVQPVVREVPASRGRTTLAAGLGEMNAYSLVDQMCATARYERYDARSESWVRINPPSQIAQTLLSRQGKWRFPVVAGVVTTPTVRPDGTLLTAAGYDAATRLYHVADPSLRLHPEVAAPTRALAARALNVLETLLSEFTFVNDVSKSVAVSGIVTSIVRGAMPVAPLTGVNAHAAGSGKSFLVDLISLISTGRICPVATAAPDETETEKRIAGLLLAGYPIVSIDNCNGELGGDLLCQAIERPLIRIRRLGGSEMFEIESSVTMFATGNNLRVRGDMVRRSLMCELDPQVERPELRKFERDPVNAILADRGRYVSACLIIVRAYILAGRPDKLDPIASFEGWSDLVRSALVWLGCADPALSMEVAREDDPELAELREMITLWGAAFGSAPTTCKAAIAASAEKFGRPDDSGDLSPYAPKTEARYPDLQSMFLQIAGVSGGVDQKKLGTWLKNREGKIVGKRRFERDGTTDGAARWKLRTIDQNRNTRG